MQKYRIRRLIEELILINIKENIDYYFEEEYFKYLKKILAKVDNENECYKLINKDKVYKKLMEDTIKDIRKLPYICDFRYFINEDLD